MSEEFDFERIKTAIEYCKAGKPLLGKHRSRPVIGIAF